jgi:hypothetical protein
MLCDMALRTNKRVVLNTRESRRFVWDTFVRINSAPHHAGTNGRQRGASRREDALDTVIALRRPEDYSPEQGADSKFILKNCAIGWTRLELCHLKQELKV